MIDSAVQANFKVIGFLLFHSALHSLMLLLLLSRFSHVRICATPEMAAHQAPHPWDAPGKNTGVGCYFLLQCMKVKSESEFAQSCPTYRPHGLQPTRLLRPWAFPGKSTGVGCHCLLKCMKVKSEREVTQSCPTLCDLMDCSLRGSSIHGIFQARVLEWGAIAFSDL